MSEHTPGPWQFFELMSGDDGLGYIRPDPEDGREIAYHGDMGRPSHENRANARLIAAAPDMLAALKAHVEARRLSGRVGWGDKWDEAMRLTRAAIAKAEGAD